MKLLIIFAVLATVALARPQVKFNFPRKHVTSLGPAPRRLNYENSQSASVEPPAENVEDDFEEEEEEEEDEVLPVIQPTTRKPILPRSFNTADNVRSERVSKKSPAPRNYVPNEYELEQNKAAKYEFQSNVEDNINDLTQQRSETRDGLAVKGMYAYSDGYFKRTVHYEADDKGYRIVKMETEPLEGPQIDLNGSASVSNDAHGSQITYRVQSVPVEGPKGKIIN